jgi:hypothetical protein
MHPKPPTVLFLNVVAPIVKHLNIVLPALVLLSFALLVKSAKRPAYELPPRISRFVVIEALLLGCSTTLHTSHVLQVLDVLPMLDFLPPSDVLPPWNICP